MKRGHDFVVPPDETTTKELHIAPMMQVSNREFRYFMRLLTRHAILWTEMVSDEILYYVSRECDNDEDGTKNRCHKLEHCLSYDPTVEHPIVCQIGATRKHMTAVAARLVQKYDFDEINLNMGCPSTRVCGGRRQSGAVLMKDVTRAVGLVATVQENVVSSTQQAMRVSVKCRIGVDDWDDWDFLVNWIEELQREAGCRRFFLHARKCLLKGLSPTQNRTVPPLNYPMIYRLCEHFPHIDFWINGEIPNLEVAKMLVIAGARTENFAQHNHVPCSVCQAPNGSCTVPPVHPPRNLRGCMLGRAAMENPALFWDVDRYFYGQAANPAHTRRQVLNQYGAFLERSYPRRCCDEDDRKTLGIPVPNVSSICHHCHVCGGTGSEEESRAPEILLQATITPKAKIAYGVMERSLKPVRNFFWGLPTHASFQRMCDQLCHDMTIRNCGPAFALRRAIKIAVDTEDLDRPFVDTPKM